ncbi:MAG: insulinase family protein [Elusimicrobia bacterium]|nr:insulinase family protein [Elusimicrobiota bacterium]
MKTIKILLLAVLLLPGLAWAGAPQVPEPLDMPLPSDLMQTTIHRLPNGLTVYLSPSHETPRIAAWIAVRAGSKMDPADSTGLAHYLEHMDFKGTTSIGTLDYEKEKPHLDRITRLYEEHFRAQDPAERERIYKEIDKENLAAEKYEIPNEISKIYKRLGFKGLNAFTSNEETVYVVDLPSNRAEAWAKLEAERFAHPVFRLFQNELEVVYEEKNMSMDNMEELLSEVLNKQLYKLHPYGTQTTIGTIEHLKNPSLAQMYGFFDRYYRPNNMAIVLAGDFERKPMLELVAKCFGSWQPQAPPAPRAWPLPKPKGREFVEVKYEAEEKAVIAWPTVPRGHPDADALRVMDMLMDNSVAGLINLDLVQAQKVKAAGSGPTFYNEAGDWGMWAVTKKGQKLEAAEALLMSEVDKLKAGGFSEDDIRAVITNFEVSEKAKLESNGARAAEMADSFVHLEPWPVAAGRLDRLRRVTKADVLRVANLYLGPDRVAAFRRNAKPDIPNIAKPGFSKVDIDPARESDFAKGIYALPAQSLEPRWLTAGRDYTVTPLPSGRLYATKNPFNDLFQLSWVFDRGRRHERDLCAALDLLELSGAGRMSAEEFKKKLFGLGTSLGYRCGEWESSVFLTGLDANLWASLRLMSQRFDSPDIEPDMLKRMVEVQIGAHADAKKDPEAVFSALGDFSFRGREGSVLNELSDAELLALKSEKLRRLMRESMGFQRRTTYVGNRESSELAKLMEEPGRDYRPAPAHTPMRYQKPAQPVVYFTHRDMVQSQVGVFAADGVLDPERVVDYSFLGSYLGGGMNSVIFQEVREARSLAYSAWGGYSYAGHKGDENMVYGELGTQADKTVEAATLLRDLVKSPPWSEPRFTDAARAIEENYRTNPIPFRSIPGALLGWEDQGITGGDPRPQRFEKALKYRLDDLKAFARHLQDKVMTVYVLGNRDRLGLDGLKRLGDLQEKKLEQLFPY